jgi:pimeloyl-ACP methyl ester carboxylesterase
VKPRALVLALAALALAVLTPAATVSSAKGTTTKGTTTKGATTKGATTNGATTKGATTNGATTNGAPRNAPAPHAHYANVNGLRMYYQDQGAGKVLLLIHGGGSTVETSFGAVLPELARTHRVIAVEEQGHGHTEDLPRPLSFEQMADDTAALLDQLHVRDADVLGFSNGGMTALQLAVRHPSLVHRLIVCSGFYAHAGLIPALRSGFEQPPDASQMPKPLRDAYLAASPHPDLPAFVTKTVAMMRSFPDIPEDKLRAVEAPTLVMLGDQDVILPEHAERLAKLVKQGQLAIFPGAQHGAYLGVAESPPSPKLVALGVATIAMFLSE